MGSTMKRLTARDFQPSRPDLTIDEHEAEYDAFTAKLWEGVPVLDLDKWAWDLEQAEAAEAASAA